jgi:hypothetical protein
MLPSIPPEAFFASMAHIPTLASSFGLELRFLFGPVLLFAIFGIHFVYYRKALQVDGQQVIALDDLTNLTASVGGTSVIQADNVQFCRLDDLATAYRLPAGQRADASGLVATRATRRFERSISIANKDVAMPLICAEDLLAEHNALFRAPVKVGGDLTVRGEVTFDQTVVVNGALKVEGHAHFSRGLIVKGDTLVTGDITIGTRDNKGWAVFRKLSFSRRLRLNGHVITDQDLNLPAFEQADLRKAA